MPAGCVGILGGTKAGGLELAAVQLRHKRITTTDEHYDERQMDDLKKAAELIDRSGQVLPRIEPVMKKIAFNSSAYSPALNCEGRI